MEATIIIPTRSRNSPVKRAIKSLLSADPNRSDVEILVVDNNDDDQLSDELRSVCLSAGKQVRYSAEPSPGLSAARHLGARQARGDILIYIDDDVLVSKRWLDSILLAFSDCGIDIVGGPSIPFFESSIPDWFWSFVEPTPFGGWNCGWLSLLDIGKDVEDIKPIWIWGLNFAIRKKTLFQLGGFHPDLVPSALQRWQGDGETGLAYRALASGVRSVYVHNALLHHVIGADRLTPDYFTRRAYYQGVCDSFTKIRSGEPPSANGKGPRKIPSETQNSGWKKSAHEVRVATAIAYNEGWIFHQREAFHDPSLLGWIRQENYLTADIRKEL